MLGLFLSLFSCPLSMFQNNEKLEKLEREKSVEEGFVVGMNEDLYLCLIIIEI